MGFRTERYYCLLGESRKMWDLLGEREGLNRVCTSMEGRRGEEGSGGRAKASMLGKGRHG